MEIAITPSPITQIRYIITAQPEITNVQGQKSKVKVIGSNVKLTAQCDVTATKTLYDRNG